MKLKIELLSDLIPGSGTGKGNIVDTDITFNEYGLPYIGARRIKGILKESANELVEFGLFKKDLVNELFGNDQIESNNFKLSNAVVENYDKLTEEILLVSPTYKKYLSQTHVLNSYTSIRYQTAIEDSGIAKKGSLRAARVINKNTVFYAPIQYNPDYQDFMEKIVKNTRHMGMNRTRGYGEIKVSLVSDQTTVNKIRLNNLLDDTMYDLTLKLSNQSQIRVASTKNEDILDYISGASIMGYYANQRKDIADFDNLFLKGNLKFSNGYISDENWNEYKPIRASMYKTKVAKTLYDKALGGNVDNEVLSRVKNQYISFVDSKCYLKETNKEIVYHHRRPDDPSIGHALNNEIEGQGTFYQIEVISANQRFISHIYGKGKDLKAILNGLDMTMAIGSSKNIQYGNITIEEIVSVPLKNSKINKDQKVTCELVSPLLLLDSFRYNDLDLSHLAEQLHLKDVETFVNYNQIGGYNSKWQLQKPSYQAFGRGTVLVGTLTQDVNEKEFFGELQNEGLGQVIYTNYNNQKSKEIDPQKLVDNKPRNATPKYTVNIIHESAMFDINIKALHELYNSDRIGKKLNNSLISRILNTLLQSKDWEEFKETSLEIKSSDQSGKREKQVKDIVDAIENTASTMYKDYAIFINKDLYSNDQFCYELLKKYLTKEKMEGR